MFVEIKIPTVGESINQGVLNEWLKQDGDIVQVDDPLFELETDKITMTVPAEQTGRLEIRVAAGSKVTIGQVVGVIDTSANIAEIRPLSPTEIKAAPSPATPAAIVTAEQGKSISPSPYEALAPSVRRLIEEHQLEPSQIPASGRGGRLTKEDVLRYLEQKSNAQPQAEISATIASTLPPPATATAKESLLPLPSPVPSPKVAPSVSQQPKAESARQTREPISPLRQRTAERLVMAQQTAAILTTFNEADLSAVMTLRTRHREAFRQAHGIDLGLMPFFVKAAIDALRRVPLINAQIQGDEIVYNHFYDIGIAVGTEHGLVVPILRDAEQLSFAQIQKAIEDFSRRAQNKTLTLNELTGGTFTISNGGIYGSMLSTPILNPPQSAILGMHAIKKRPVIVNEEIAIRPMMYLALSYDHRLIDGREAVTFLKRIVECLENPERMFLEV